MQSLARSAFRYLAIMLAVAGGVLVVGILGGGHAPGQPDDRPSVGQQGARAQAAADEARLRERAAAARERVDRYRRGAPQPDGERFSLAEEADRSPAPAPEPTAADPGEPAGPVPASCGDYRGNRATGCGLLLDAGFGIDQMSCLDQLWTHESGWNELAENPSSGAYGIPQALPGDKMSAYGDDWRTNPVTQIRWGLDYIGDRYGTPCGAWGFWQANNWY